MIPFNRPPLTGNEEPFVLKAIHADKMSGDGEFGRLCQQWFERYLPCSKALMTTSCTHALEMAAMLINIQPGDEVIMPSFTFVSTANAFALQGAKIVFVDIRPDTMNIDEKKIEAAVTEKTKAIVPVHYGGVGCDMDTIMGVARRYGLFVIEDAAQAMTSSYKGRKLGAIGHLGTFSFHETKNYTSGGEGGLLIINDDRFVARAEVIREKGTNRSRFFRGEVDKYSWVDLGSSYLPSELQSAYLWGQLVAVEEIRSDRMRSWHYYHAHLESLEKQGYLERQAIHGDAEHNAHLFYIKVENFEIRTRLLEHLKAFGIMAVFHYVPLHTSEAGQRYGVFHGSDRFTTVESDRLIRLPMYYGLTQDEQQSIINCIGEFFTK